MKGILHWLNGDRNWTQGLSLIRQHISDPSIRNLFSADSETPLYRELMFEHIRSVYYQLKESKSVTAPVQPLTEPAQPLTAPVQPKPQFQSGAVPVVSTPEEPVILNPELSAQCKLEADKLYKYMMNIRALLFGQCNVNPTPGENAADVVAMREVWALQIMELQYQVDQAYEKFRHVQAHGCLPDAPKSDDFVLPSNPIELFQMKLNLKKSINKLKAKEATPERISLIQSKQQQLKQVLDALDSHQSGK